MNRDDPGMRNREIVLEIGSTTKEIQLRNVADVETFTIDPPVIADKVKMTIKGVYQACKNGGALNVYGVKCISEKNGAEIDSSGKRFQK